MRRSLSTIAHRSVRFSVSGVPLLAVSLVAGTLALDALADSARSASATPHVTVDATLLDVTGAPVAGVPVQLAGLVPDAHLTVSRPLAETTTGADGSFALSTNPSTLPRDSDGFVQLEIATVGTPAATSFLYDVRALPPEAGGAWTLELPPVSPPADASSVRDLRGRGAGTVRSRLRTNVGGADTTLVLQRGAGLIADATTSSVPGVRARDVPATVTPEDDAAAGATLTAPAGETLAESEETGTDSDTVVVDPAYGPEDVPAARAGSCRAGDTAAWANTDAYTWSWVPTKFGRTLTQATFRWRIARSQETDLQASLNVAGLSSALGFMGSLHEDSDLTVEPVMGHSQREIFYMKWRYRRQQRICVRTNPATGYYRVNAFRWVPDGPTGGNILLGTGASFACGGKGPKYHDVYGSNTTLSRGRTVTFDGFFQVAGVTLDAKQSERSEQAFTIQPNPRGGAAAACGSDDRPIAAALSKEV